MGIVIAIGFLLVLAAYFVHACVYCNRVGIRGLSLEKHEKLLEVGLITTYRCKDRESCRRRLIKEWNRS